MPISLPVETRRVSQSEFADIAYEVVGVLFEVHRDFGRLLDEKIYKRELAVRMNDVALEVPITVSYEDFSKQYSLDVLRSGSGLFELKATEAIHPRHVAQTVNYLLLSDLPHAKILNVRPEKVQQEFVNCNRRLVELRNPKFSELGWDESIPGAAAFREWLQTLVKDWGSGLDLALYNAGLCHFLCGRKDVPIFGSIGELGSQPMSLAAPNVAFRLTGFNGNRESYVAHTTRLLMRTDLHAILWANITFDEIQLQTITRNT